MIFGGKEEEAPQADAAQVEESRREANRFRMKYDAVNRLYASSRWRKFRAVMLAKNPLCQRILKHPVTHEPEQCHNKSAVVHHRVSPRVREDLFLVASNVICFCDKGCHPAGVEGDPQGWREGVDFVPTQLPKWSL
jgi:hypothetical protein